jgi:hypothetical protein
MLSKKLKRWSLLSLVVFLLGNMLITTFPAKTHAAGNESFLSDKLQGNVLDHQLYYYLKRCFILKNMDKVTQDEVDGWEWFKEGDLNSGISGGYGGVSTRGDMYENSVVGCDDGQFIEEAFSRFGFTDARDTFCSLSFTFNTSSGGLGGGKDGRGAGSTKEACLNGFNSSSDFDGFGSYDTQSSALDSLLSKSAKYNKAKGALTSEEEYVRTYRTFMRGCAINLIEPYTEGKAAGKPTLYKVGVVDQDGKVSFWLGQGKTDSTSVRLVATLDSKFSQYKTCGELAQGTVRLADAYKNYLQGPGRNDAGSVGGAGSTTATADKSCYSEGGALSWILCPVIDAVDATLKWLDEQINQLLFIDSRYYSTANVGGSWSAMRNIAYLILIPMMLLMVIGTALGFGPFDAYTVKKALPRMLIAVIFISLSLPITQLGIVVSNNIGNGIGNFIMSTVPADNQVNSLKDIITYNSSGGTDTTLGLSVLVVAAGGFAVGLTILSFASVAVVGLLIGFVVLIMRQVLLVALVVIAPLAILAWIFPGNDKLWGIWKTTFIAMLMMYPLISILIATGKFVAGIAG